MARRRGVRPRASGAVLIILAVADLAALPSLDASFAGAWDKRVLGCYCHSSAPNAAVVFEVTGFPAQWELGSKYSIQITLVSTDVNQTGARKAGFNAEVGAGWFLVPDGWDDLVQAYGNQATHRLNGTHRSNWTVIWQAPSVPSGVVFLWVLVNTVDGDGAAASNDHWGRKTLTSDGPSPPKGTPGPADVFSTPDGGLSWAGITLLVVPGILTFVLVARRMRRREAGKTKTRVRKRSGAGARRRRREARRRIGRGRARNRRR